MTIKNRIFLYNMTAKRLFTERKKELIFLYLLILASSLSFALGYIANRNTHRAPIIIQTCPQARI
jgi:hypothetical protein